MFTIVVRCVIVIAIIKLGRAFIKECIKECARKER